MSETQTAERSTENEQNGMSESNGEHGKGRGLARAAAIAAATGATAFAAKRALSDRGSKNEEDEGGKNGNKRRNGSGSGSAVSSVLASSWDSARHTVVPILEDAASSAGEYVAQNGPGIVTETIVPEFIRGFERGRKSSSSDDE